MRSLVLVTGATGKAGRHIVPALKAAGYEVRGQYYRAPGLDSNVDWRQMDFSQSLEFASLVDGCDAVVHLAAELHDARLMDQVNVEASRLLLRTAARSGVRYFGYASSVVVYGSPRRRLVDEQTPRIDPCRPMARQYHAEPYMLDYARTKALGEGAIEEEAPDLAVDFYRPTVIASQNELLGSRDWTRLRKLLCLYRLTQYVYAADVGAAVAHLVGRGLSGMPRRAQIEAYNICDEDCGTFRLLHRRAYAKTKDARYCSHFDVPAIADLTKDFIRRPRAGLRFPLGMLDVSNLKLRNSGFVFPTGIRKAYDAALDEQIRAGP